MGARGSTEETPCCCPRVLSGRPGDAHSSEPIRVAISGAAGQIGYSLLPMIASGAMFGLRQSVILQCLDLNQLPVKENMRGIEMELQDGSFPLLRSALFSTDDAQVFNGAHYAILLGSFPRQENQSKWELMEKNVLIFRSMGRAIQENASKNCKVLVVGSPANTNALICSAYAPSLPKENVFALSRLEQNRACGMLAARAKASVADVRNVVMWGAQGRGILDLAHVTVKGKPLKEVLTREQDKAWLQKSFAEELRARGSEIAKARKASSALSTACSIVHQVRDLHCGSPAGEIVCMGVWSDKNPYGLDGKLNVSLPVQCLGRGRYRVATGLPPGGEVQAQLKEVERELIADRELAKELLAKHGPATLS